MALIVALFIGLTVSAEEIFRDRKLLKREAFLNLSRTSYLFSKISILLVLSAIQSITFVLIANGILQLHDMYFEYWIMLFSTAVFANLLGLNISATFNSAVTIYIVIPLVMIPMMVLSGAMFSFDKLNRAVGSFGRVPLIAEFMVTKWGYEGLVVHQFKDNDFNKTFYEVEKKLRNADYKTVYYILELEKIVNENIELIETSKDSKKNEEKFENNLLVLRNSIFKESNFLAPAIPYQYLDKLYPKTFDYEVAYATIDYLSDLSKHYSKIYQQANQKSERLIAHLVSTDPQLYEAKKNASHNESIADLATNKFEKNKILQYKGELVQQYDPIYRDPIPNNQFDFRSHFLAPQKHFFGRYYDTLWFNICFIWFMILILYITLYFELLKKMIDFFGKIRVPKLKK